MRVLITGATGFVGGYLAHEITQNEPSAQVWGTTTHSSAVASISAAIGASYLPDGVRLLSGDIRDVPFLRDVIDESQPDQVYHLAGYASGAGTDRDQIFEVNVTATRTLLEALRDTGRDCHVLLASSGYVYGATNPRRPAEEGDAPAPVGAYAESKAAMESEVVQFGSPDGPLRLTAARSFNHTGPRQTTEFVVPAFARQIAQIEHQINPPVIRVGNLDALRDFLDVRDVVRAYRLLSGEDSEQTRSQLRIVNVCSGVTRSIRSILDQLIELAHAPVTIETDQNRMRPSDLAACAGNSQLLSELTGWRSQISFAQTISDTLNWWRGVVATENAPSR